MKAITNPVTAPAINSSIADNDLLLSLLLPRCMVAVIWENVPKLAALKTIWPIVDIKPIIFNKTIEANTHLMHIILYTRL